MTGGVPWYLEQIQPKLNADENIKNLCFKKNGILVDEFDLNTDTPIVELVGRKGKILANLSVGVDVSLASPLIANQGIAIRGVCLVGRGFVVRPKEANLLGLGKIKNLENHIKPYFNGRDISQRPRGVLVIDLEGLSSSEVQKEFPDVFQRILDRVKPERDQNREPYRRENWWVFGRKHTDLRRSITGLSRYIVTAMTAKHRVFSFLDGTALPDQGHVSIDLDDAFYLGWMRAINSRLSNGLVR